METTFYPLKTPDIDQVLLARYGFGANDVWPEENNSTLIKIIYAEAKKLGKNIINTIPPHFNQIDLDFEPIPQYRFPSWPELENNFEFYGIYNNGVLLTSPSLWQFVYPFQHMVRRHRLFLGRTDRTNIPLGGEIIRQAKCSCLVSSEEEAIAMQKELSQKKIKDILKLVVVTRGVGEKIGSDADYNFGSATVLWEMQVFPGHTIAYQAFGNTGDPNRFHLSSRYLWRFTSDATYITGIDKTVLPFLNYRLPVVLEPVSLNTKVPAFKFRYV